MHLLQLVVSKKLLYVVCLIAASASVACQNHIIENDVIIEYCSVSDSCLLAKLDSLYKIIEHSNYAVGYFYIHPSTKMNGTSSTVQILRVGWRNEPMKEIMLGSRSKQLFLSHQKKYAIFMLADTLEIINHTVLGEIILSRSFIDTMLHPEQELILTDQLGDTVLYNPKWRPSSLYIHPQFEIKLCQKASP